MLLLGGVIIGGTIIAIFIHNMAEIAYWKYIDWKYGDEHDYDKPG